MRYYAIAVMLYFVNVFFAVLRLEKPSYKTTIVDIIVSMYKLRQAFKHIIIIFLTINIASAQACLMNGNSNDVNSHLAEFSKYNNTHHDNIDDEPHTHTHKHSEDGDEHEHNHEHFKVTQSEIKLLNHSIKVLAKVTVIEIKQGFSEKNLISNPHPSKIYRPPIDS